MEDTQLVIVVQLMLRSLTMMVSRPASRTTCSWSLLLFACMLTFSFVHHCGCEFQQIQYVFLKMVVVYQCVWWPHTHSHLQRTVGISLKFTPTTGGQKKTSIRTANNITDQLHYSKHNTLTIIVSDLNIS